MASWGGGFWKPPKTPTWPTPIPKGIAAPPPPNYGGVAAGAGSQQTDPNQANTQTQLTDQFNSQTNSGSDQTNANNAAAAAKAAADARAKNEATYGKSIAAIQLLDQLHQNYMQQIDLANKNAQQSKDIGTRKAGSSAVVRGASATQGFRQQLQ